MRSPRRPSSPPLVALALALALALLGGGAARGQGLSTARAMAEREVSLAATVASTAATASTAAATAPATTPTTAPAGADLTAAMLSARVFAAERLRQAQEIAALVSAPPPVEPATRFFQYREALRTFRERLDREAAVAREQAELAAGSGHEPAAARERERAAALSSLAAVLARAGVEAQDAWLQAHPDERERKAAEVEALRALSMERAGERQDALVRGLAAAADLERSNREDQVLADRARRDLAAARTPDEREVAELRLACATMNASAEEFSVKTLQAEAEARDAEGQLQATRAELAELVPVLLKLPTGAKRLNEVRRQWTADGAQFRKTAELLDKQVAVLRDAVPALREQAARHAERYDRLVDDRDAARADATVRQKLPLARAAAKRAAELLEQHRQRLEWMERTRVALLDRAHACSEANARLREVTGTRFLGQTAQQWVTFAFLFWLTLLCAWLLHHPIEALFRRLARRTLWAWDDIALDELALPARALVLVLGSFAALAALSMEPATQAALGVLRGTLEVALTGFFLWRLVNVAHRALEPRFQASGTTLDDQLLRFVSRGVRGFIAFFTGLYMLESLGWQISSLLAGLGIGGLAIALAAQDTLANLFGSMVLFLDRPFRVGNWVRVADAEGIVEDIGIRSTRIRTFKDTIITIPNAKVANSSAENVHAFRRRRLDFELVVRLDTPPDRIELLLERIRALLDGDPMVDKDYAVAMTGLTENGLKVLVYCFVKTRAWTDFMKAAQAVYLTILRTLPTVGVTLAYPTHTVRMDQGAAAPPLAAREPDLALARGERNGDS